MGIEVRNTDTLMKFNIEKLGNKSEDDPRVQDYWMIVEVSVRNKWFNFYDKSESLEYSNIVHIKNVYEKIQKGEITENTGLGFTEPDFEFVLHPPFKFGNDTIGCSMDFIINLTDNSKAYNGEQYLLPLDDDETAKFIDYLNQVIVNLKPKNYSE
jgi:hypothetical protein